MSFVRRTGTTEKVYIPAGAKKEAELTFLHEIINKLEKFQTHSSFVLNLDQTNSKYVSMGKTTMAEIQIPSPPLAWMTKEVRRNFNRNFKWKISLHTSNIWRGKKAYLNLSFPLDFPCLLQSWKRYIRQALVFLWNNTMRENFNFYFSEVFS